MNSPGMREVFEGWWLPHAPLSAPGKDGPYFRASRELALTQPYIEANPLVLCSLIVTDTDNGDADEVAGLLGLPQPSYIAINPHTRNGHITYAVEPVCLTDAAHRRPVNLLARVETGFTTVLGGDVAYGGRTTKNPLHDDHTTIWGGSGARYGLRELAAALDVLGALPKYDNHRAVTISGVGRNCALFELLRRWAYRRRADYRDHGEWREVVHAYALHLNATTIADNFTRGPMDGGEVRHLARSVADWTWTKIQRTFEQEQARRGGVGGRNGTGAAKQRHTVTDAVRDANRKRATKYDEDLLREVIC
jgi:hypothetical protein